MKKLIILSAIAISGFIYTAADAQQHNNQHSDNQRHDSYRQQSQPNRSGDSYGQHDDNGDRGGYDSRDRGSYDQRFENRDRGRESSGQNEGSQREDRSYGGRSAQYSRQDAYANHRTNKF